MSRPSLLRPTFAIALLLTFLPTAYAQSPIPDEIDFQKYLTLYNQAKSASDAKRAAADQASQDLSNAQANLAKLDASLREQQDSIAQTQGAIVSFQQEIANLQNENQALAQEVNRHQSDLSGAKTLADRAGQNAQQLQGRLNQEQSTYANLQASYQRENASYQAVQNRLAQATADRDQAGRDFANARDRFAQVQNQLGQAQANLKSSSDAITRLQLSVSNLTPQLTAAQSELASVTAQVSAAQSGLQSYYDRERSAQSARDAANGALSGAQSRVDQASSALNANRNEQNQLASTISALTSSIATNQRDLDNLSNSISDAQNTLSNLTIENSAIDAQMPALVSQINDLVVEQGDLSTQIDRKRIQLAAITDPNDPQVAQLNSEIADLSAKRNQVAQLRIDLQGKKSGLDSRKTELVGALSSARANVASLQSKAQSLPGTIASQKSQLSSSQSRKDQLSSQEGTLTSALDNARSGLGSLQADASAKDSAYQAAVRDRQNAEAPLAPLRAKQSDLTARRDALGKQLNDNQTELANQRSNNATARTQVQQLGSESSTLQSSLAGLQYSFDQKSRAVDTFAGAVRDAYNRAVVAQQAANQQASVVASIAQSLAQAQAQYQQYAQQANDLTQLINQKQATLSANDQRSKEDASNVTSYQNALPAMQRQLVQITQARQTTAAQIAPLQTRYSTLEQAASVLEAESARRYSVYQDRQNRFNAQAADSKASGTDQGQRLGQRDGPTKGDADGVKDGKAKGTQSGITDGLAFGLQSGTADGDAKGYADGHAKGIASAADYQAGIVVGNAAGKQQAQNEATTIDYPKGKIDRRAATLALVPVKSIEIDNATGVAITAAALTANFVSPSAANQVVSIAAAERAAVFAKNSAAVSFAMDRNSEWSILAVAARPAATCNQAYAEFRKVCTDAFNAAYDAAFQAAYADSYARSFQPASDAAYRVAYDANKAVKYAQGYKAGVAAGTTRGLNEGKVEAKNKGVSDGQTAGYNSVIATLKASEYARGAQEFNDALAAAAYVDIRAAAFEKIAGGSLGASVISGDRLALRLSAANLGAKDSLATQIQVSAEALTPNVAVENKVVRLAAIPTGTLASVKNVLAVKILDGAFSGGTEKVKLHWNDSEGVLHEQIVSIIVVPAITGTINQIIYNAKPKPGKMQAIQVIITNTSNVTPTQPMTLFMSSAQSADIHFDNPTIPAGPFLPGSTSKWGDLNYTFPSKDAIARGVTVKIQLRSGLNVIAEQTFTIQH